MKPRYYVHTNTALAKGQARHTVKDRTTGDSMDTPERYRKDAQGTADDLNRLDAAMNMDPHDRQDFVTIQIASGKYHWCRSRLFNALARAEEQGKLREVLGEVLDDDEFINTLTCLGGDNAAVAEKVKQRFVDVLKQWNPEE